MDCLLTLFVDFGLTVGGHLGYLLPHTLPHGLDPWSFISECLQQ